MELRMYAHLRLYMPILVELLHIDKYSPLHVDWKRTVAFIARHCRRLFGGYDFVITDNYYTVRELDIKYVGYDHDTHISEFVNKAFANIHHLPMHDQDCRIERLREFLLSSRTISCLDDDFTYRSIVTHSIGILQ
jgi:hypothetical protein